MATQQVEEKILNCLREEFPKDLSIEEIATRTHMHRNTVSKYMWGLEKEKKVAQSRTVGRGKMYIISKR
jgi:DNA-binding IclR family transcriptional regulator